MSAATRALRALLVTVAGASCATAPPAARAPARPWHRWVSTEVIDAALAVAPGPGGALYALGRDAHGVFVAGFTRDGERAWQRTLHGVGEGPPPALAVDPAGHVYVAGGFVGRLRVGEVTLRGRGREDVFLLRLEGDGAVAWARQYGGARFETAHAVATDAQGNVYLTGAFQGSMDLGGGAALDNELNFDVFVAKLDARGNHLWSAQLRDRGSTDTRGSALALGPDGDVYVTGTLARDVLAERPPPASAQRRAFVARLAPGGGVRWLRLVEASASADGADLALDGDGRVLVTGRFTGELGTSAGAHRAEADDLFVAAWDGEGTPLWVRALGSPGYDVPGAVAADGAGDVFVAGGTGGALTCAGERWPGDGPDGFLARFDRDGVPRGRHLLASDGDDIVNDLWLDPAGMVWLAGAGGALRLGGGGHTLRGAVDGFWQRASLAALGLPPSPARPPRGAPPAPGPPRRIAPPADRNVAVMRIRLNSDGESLANVPFSVEGAREAIEGTSDDEGVVEFRVPSDLEEVTLTLPDRGLRIPVQIGTLDPIDEPSGQAQRLAALGYGDFDTAVDRLRASLRGDDEAAEAPPAEEALRAALRRFQAVQSLPPTGRADAATIAALRRAAGD